MQGWSAPRPALKRNSFLLVGRINRPATSGNWASLLNWRVRQTVVDQKRCAFGGKIVRRLRTGILDVITGLRCRRNKKAPPSAPPERLQIHGSSKNLELIAEITQTFQPMIDIEKSRQSQKLMNWPDF
jgi:hypothetical protein